MESEATDVRPFQVDLRGVVDLLGRHIYSGPRVYLRELLQNGLDAITAREQWAAEAGDGDRQADGASQAGGDRQADSASQAGGDRQADSASQAGGELGIRVFPADDSEPFRLVDAGIGLTVDEVGDLLATVGRSSKRDILDLPRSDYLGQFGIGLLSCFMVSDRIVIRSRSIRGTAAVEWTGDTDGTFTVRELSADETDAMPIGTEVVLHPRHGEGELLGRASVLALAREYGEFLPVEVGVAREDGSWSTINRPAVFALSGQARAEPGAASSLRAYGRELIGAEPLDAIELAVPGTGVTGTAFVLPFSPPPGSKQANRVYLGGMLLSERVDDLLPGWAFFVRCAITTTVLRPTASREQLVEDESLEFTRVQLGEAVRAWVLGLGTSDPAKLTEFVRVHHLALRALAVHDDELAGFITAWLSVETSNGMMTIDELVRRHPHIRYAATVDEFRQIASIVPRESPVVNGGYIYDTEILRRLPLLFDGVTVEQVTVSSALDHLDAPPLAERSITVALEARAAAVLTATGCDVVLRIFAPQDLASLYLADAEVLRQIDRGAARSVASPLWGGVLGRIDEQRAAARAQAGAAAPRARLCLNWSNPLVRTLSAVEDQAVFARTVQLLYVQSLLAGHRPLTSTDRGMLTTAMNDLVQLSIGSV